MNEPLLPFLVAARFAQFISLFVLFGVLLFPFYATHPTPAPCGERLASSTRKAIPMAGIVQALSILAWVAASIASMGDGWTSLGDAELVKAFFFETSFGRLWLIRLLLTALLAGTLFGRRKRLMAANAPTGIALVLVGALLASQAGIGHPAALPDEQRPFVFAGYALHLFGGAAWIGGLWPLAAVLAEARTDQSARAYVQFVLRRFATMATIAVAAVLVGAALNIRPLIASLDLFAPTSWTWAGASKIVLFGALIAIAYHNRFVLTPLLDTRPAEASKDLHRNVIVDQCLAVVVLAAAAVMGMSSPSA